MDQICRKDECYGCGLCANICPVDAITISLQEYFYRPQIDNEKCIGCGKCTKICMALNIDKSKYEKFPPKRIYAGWSNNNEIHYNCASGGMATEITRKFIDQYKGNVYGCAYDDNLFARHIKVSEATECYKISKSKYVFSDIKDSYTSVISDLKLGYPVLFIGVPCQVYAIKSAVLKEDPRLGGNLYLIDLLCRGGASPKLFKEHLKRVMKGQVVDNVTFRGGDYDCLFTAYNHKKIVYQRQQFEDEYFFAFMQRSIFAPKCYECPFADGKRIGDITLGDFWGISPEFSEAGYDKGINLVMVNSLRGSKLIDMVQKSVNLFERTFTEAAAGNDTLREPTKKPEEYEAFWNSINKKGFHKSLKKYYNNEPNKRFYKRMLKTGIKRILPQWLYKIIKRKNAKRNGKI